ncbi:HalOD1 output domain-containing protein [Halocatena marina]|nr:HalOD1 output domain-containing protein [Halocatena marina]
MDMDRYHTILRCTGDTSLSSTIIEAIAAIDRVEPNEMEPIYSAIDPDALEQLVESLRRSSHQKGDERAEFTFDGYRVTVLSSGEIEIRQHTTETRGEPTDEMAFHLALTHLLQTATANGVDIEGGWGCRNKSDSKWGVEIYGVKER